MAETKLKERELGWINLREVQVDVLAIRLERDVLANLEEVLANIVATGPCRYSWSE